MGAVLGSYRITGVLAAGGMGMVFTAKHESLDRLAAVKLLRRDLTGDADLVQRFIGEAKAASAIRHPGIIEVYDFGYTDDGHAYMVMELLVGEVLSGRLKKGRLAESDAIHVTRGIATALAAAHGKGIVHRDLKPDNVFLVSDANSPTGERPKLLDFGIAKLVDGAGGQTQTGALIGTPLYMAPEQARAARSIDHRADLYSLGCMLYEMLVGRPPFVADGAGEIIALHMFGDVEPPSKTIAITPDLEAIVMRLLEKEPADRFASAQAVIDAIVALRASGQVAPAFAAASNPRLPVMAPATHAGPSTSSNSDTMVPTVVNSRPAPVKSRMPLVAGAITVGLAVIVLAIVLIGRGGGNESSAATTTPPADAATTSIVPVKPVTPAKKPPAPPKKQHVDDVIITSPTQVDHPVDHPEIPKPPKKPPATINGKPVLDPEL